MTPIPMSVILQAEQDPHNKHMKRVYQFALEQTRKMLDAEGLTQVTVELTPHLKTYARYHYNQGNVSPKFIRLGTQMLDIAYRYRHSRIYIVYEHQLRIAHKRVGGIDAVLSIVIEEVAHQVYIVRHNANGGHGPGFQKLFIELWERNMNHMLREYNVLMGGSHTP